MTTVSSLLIASGMLYALISGVPVLAWSHQHSFPRTKQTFSLSMTPSTAPDEHANKNNNGLDNQQYPQSYSLLVTYEGRTCTTQVRKGETILAALERTGAADQMAMPGLPQDCRRGNCLTCVGTLASSGQENLVVRGEDGLSPYMSSQAKKRGYIVTCSSYVVGDGVHIQLGDNNKAWDDLYRSRLQEESTQQVGREAMAKVIRISNERNVVQWAKETEEVLNRTFEDDSL